MSKIALSPNAAGTATFTLAAPGTNTDRTLNLPDAAGTVALTSQIPAAPTIASTAEAQAGTNNTNFITPLRLREGFNASGSAPVYGCRAWVNFNGTGTVAIRGSGNVSSITDHSAGNYTINMTTAMPDANYAVTGTASEDSSDSRSVSLGFDNLFLTPTTTAFRINTRNFGTSTDVDCDYVFVSVFR